MAASLSNTGFHSGVPGVKNMLFGGEGVFNTVISGPGHIWLQTMPISNVAGVLAPFLPVAK